MTHQDARYERVLCRKCHRWWQRIDWNCAAHQLTCGEQDQPLLSDPRIEVGANVIIRDNPHEHQVGVLGVVERIERGTGFGGCDLYYVRYSPTRWESDQPLPFAADLLAVVTPENLRSRATELEEEARKLRALANELTRDLTRCPD
jgi:hypothetical protein